MGTCFGSSERHFSSNMQYGDEIEEHLEARDFESWLSMDRWEFHLARRHHDQYEEKFDDEDEENEDEENDDGKDGGDEEDDDESDDGYLGNRRSLQMTTDFLTRLGNAFERWSGLKA